MLGTKSTSEAVHWHCWESLPARQALAIVKKSLHLSPEGNSLNRNPWANHGYKGGILNGKFKSSKGAGSQWKLSSSDEKIPSSLLATCEVMSSTFAATIVAANFLGLVRYQQYGALDDLDQAPNLDWWWLVAIWMRSISNLFHLL